MVKIDISTRENNPDIPVVTTSGEFDLLAKDDVRDSFSKALSEKSKGLIIDLTGITYLDSSGIGVPIAQHTLLEKCERRMVVVVDHNNHVIRRLKYLGIFNRSGIELFETIEEAEAAFPSA